MNQQDKIELSKCVAEKYEISANKLTLNAMGDIVENIWLADDDARCFRLAVDNETSIECWTDSIDVSYWNEDSFMSKTTTEKYADHSDRYEASRIAILKCLDAMKE